MSERKVDVFCTYCGKRIPENIIDCPNCGKPKTKPPIKERRYRSAPFGRTVPRRGLMEKDIMKKLPPISKDICEHIKISEIICPTMEIYKCKSENPAGCEKSHPLSKTYVCMKAYNIINKTSEK